MDKSFAREVIACLPDGRTKFYYHKDRFTQEILGRVFDRPATVQEWRQSRFARLLNRPNIKHVFGAHGGNAVSGQDVLAYWPTVFQEYLLTLGIWGSDRDDSHYQTTRKGHNIVLQMNFTTQHDESYRRCYRSESLDDLNYSGHPINNGWRFTTAWSRIDFDLDTGEALIEEIQNDWLRRAKRLYDMALSIENGIAATWMHSHFVGMNAASFISYWEQLLRPIEQTWHESMLTATINFIVDELGLRTIYYHTYEAGARLKRIEWTLPPRSLYTDIPRKFCFERVEDTPEFLKKEKRVLRQLKKCGDKPWQRLVI